MRMAIRTYWCLNAPTGAWTLVRFIPEPVFPVVFLEDDILHIVYKHVILHILYSFTVPSRTRVLSFLLYTMHALQCIVLYNVPKVVAGTDSKRYGTDFSVHELEKEKIHGIDIFSAPVKGNIPFISLLIFGSVRKVNFLEYTVHIQAQSLVSDLCCVSVWQ
jgi:hypothetical protein